MTITNSFITTMEIAADLNISKQRVHQIIKEQNLEHVKRGPILLIDMGDYIGYVLQRRRRDLATTAGRKEIKLIKSAIHDTVCNVCNAYAVNWEGTIACESGHIYHCPGEV